MDDWFVELRRMIDWVAMHTNTACTQNNTRMRVTPCYSCTNRSSEVATIVAATEERLKDTLVRLHRQRQQPERQAGQHQAGKSRSQTQDRQTRTPARSPANIVSDNFKDDGGDDKGNGNGNGNANGNEGLSGSSSSAASTNSSDDTAMAGSSGAGSLSASSSSYDVGLGVYSAMTMLRLRAVEYTWVRKVQRKVGDLLTHSFVSLFTHSLSITHPRNHPPTHSPTYTLTYSLTHSLTHSFTRLLSTVG
jgi:hypothetical protein